MRAMQIHSRHDCSQGLADAPSISGRRPLLPRADLARSVILMSDLTCVTGTSDRRVSTGCALQAVWLGWTNCRERLPQRNFCYVIFVFLLLIRSQYQLNARNNTQIIEPDLSVLNM